MKRPRRVYYTLSLRKAVCIIYRCDSVESARGHIRETESCFCAITAIRRGGRSLFASFVFLSLSLSLSLTRFCRLPHHACTSGFRLPFYTSTRGTELTERTSQRERERRRTTQMPTSICMYNRGIIPVSPSLSVLLSLSLSLSLSLCTFSAILPNCKDQLFFVLIPFPPYIDIPLCESFAILLFRFSHVYIYTYT